jgi:hypothetical protein
MSRSGYTGETDDNWCSICWRGAVASAIRGRRGQAFLREMLAALAALPAPRLIKNDFSTEGEVCALGAVARSRGLDVTTWMDRDDPYFGEWINMTEGFSWYLTLPPSDAEVNRDRVVADLAIPNALACEIMYENDEGTWREETPEQRFARVRAWIEGHLR